MGIYSWKQRSRSKKAAEEQLMLLQQSEKVFRLSVFRVLLLTSVKVGLGHGNLGKMLLEEDTECFAFLAGHESLQQLKVLSVSLKKANKVRQKPLRVILNGLGKDAAQIIARINGFTYVETEMDYYTGEVKEVFRKAYSDGLRAKVNCYGANDVTEGVAIMLEEGVDVSITGNSTNPTRFQHPVAWYIQKRMCRRR